MNSELAARSPARWSCSAAVSGTRLEEAYEAKRQGLLIWMEEALPGGRIHGIGGVHSISCET